MEIHTATAVKKIEKQEDRLLVRGENGFEKTCDMVLVATGSRPETALARSAGIETGTGGAIRVDRRMATKLPDIYAAGDCAETYHCLLEKNAYLPLGTTAHKQGRIAGENMAGGSRAYMGSLGTQSVKIFGLVAAAPDSKMMKPVKKALIPSA
ncbi:MAG: FAD-dependent oxidoreductase [Candidatus Marinimicrobia bacterium]|nr:FAD-dependent oxidoreductase [Candidatus Neomarinimicrobiota bacterium]